MHKLKDSRELLHQFTYVIYTLSLGSFSQNSLSILVKKEDLFLIECQTGLDAFLELSPE